MAPATTAPTMTTMAIAGAIWRRRRCGGNTGSGTGRECGYETVGVRPATGSNGGWVGLAVTGACGS